MLKFFVILISISFSIKTIASSSSYLIASTAIKLFDFDEAYSHFNYIEDQSSELNLQNKLFTMVHLDLVYDAKKIAKELIDINLYNQEAWIVYLAEARISNNLQAFIEYKNQIDNTVMPLVNYIFFTQNKQMKNNKIIARSIFDIVQSSVGDLNDNNQNYNILLFYLKISTLIDQNFSEGYFYSAQIYQILDNISMAEIFYEKINFDHNLFLESQKNIAINKSKIGKFKEGEKKLLKLINQYENQNNIFNALADLYRVEGKYEKAVLYYSKIISSEKYTDSLLWRLLYYRGICYERLSKWKLAEEDFLYSLKLQPDSPQVLNYLAYGWLEKNQNIDAALTMLQKANLANPKSYYILDSLAWGYYKKNKYNNAAELMEQVISMAPGEAISLDHLGDIYFAMNRKREAIYLWKQALDLAEHEDLIIDSILLKLKENNAG